MARRLRRTASGLKWEWCTPSCLCPGCMDQDWLLEYLTEHSVSQAEHIAVFDPETTDVFMAHP